MDMSLVTLRSFPDKPKMYVNRIILYTRYTSTLKGVVFTMSNHRSDNEKKVLVQARVSECLEEEIHEFSREVLGEENSSWALRKILKEWYERRHETVCSD